MLQSCLNVKNMIEVYGSSINRILQINDILQIFILYVMFRHRALFIDIVTIRVIAKHFKGHTHRF